MKRDPVIYLVDDDTDFREATAELLESEGFATRAFDGGARMLDIVDPEWNGLVLCDVRMQSMDGFGVLKDMRARAPKVPFVMMTGHGDVRMAISAIRGGAYDFLEKPVQPDFLLGVVRRALNARKLAIENARLRRRVARFGDLRSRLVGTSPVMKDCRKQLLDLAPLPITVLLHGEAGTGKEVTARAIHDFSEVSGDLHTINCANLSEAELRQDLTAASPDDTVYFRALHRLGTEAQSIVAEFLRQPTRARTIASLTGDPSKCHDAGQISDELYYLVTVAPIRLPPLRERDKDMFVLLEMFLRDAAARFKKPLPMVTKEALKPFRTYPWPGNLRELRGVAERMVLGLPLGLDRNTATATGQAESYDASMLTHERAILERALMETGGQKGEAAAILQIPRKRLYLRMKATGLLE